MVCEVSWFRFDFYEGLEILNEERNVLTRSFWIRARILLHLSLIHIRSSLLDCASQPFPEEKGFGFGLGICEARALLVVCRVVRS